MKNLTTRRLAVSGMIGAAYAVMAIFGSVFGLTFGPIQVRFSEALCLLPFLFPETAWGLGVGCLIANLIGGAGILDIVFGSLATLIAGLLTYAMRKLPAWVALLPVVVVNGLVVGWVLNAAYGTPLLLGMGSVALGQAVVCYVLGLPLLALLRRRLPEKLLH